MPNGFLSDINPQSLTVLNGALIDRSIAGSKEYERFQFERIGYFCVDRDSNSERVGCRVAGTSGLTFQLLLSI